MEVRNKVRSVCYDMDVAKISVLGIPDKPGIAASIFVPLAEAGISVDTIVQNSSVNKIADLTFTVTKDQVKDAMKVTKQLAKKTRRQRCCQRCRTRQSQHRRHGHAEYARFCGQDV